MGWELLVAGFAAGLVIAVLTAPVGVSGAVFLLPVQLDLLQVPSPAVTPTNLLYNVVSGPGALLRYRAQGQRPGQLMRHMLLGTVPGVVMGACVRVLLIPDVRMFRLLAAVVLLPIGVWLVRRSTSGPNQATVQAVPSPHLIVALGLVVGVIGGVYGIGGGSVLAPILVARGLSISQVAPAALASTFLTSIVGAVSFALLAISGVQGAVAPFWALGVASGLGGLIGGHLGARWHQRLPERALTLALGISAALLALVYAFRALG